MTKQIIEMFESLRLMEELVKEYGILKNRDLIYSKETLIVLKEECKIYKELFETKDPELIFCEECFKKVNDYLLSNLTHNEKELVLSNKKIDNDTPVNNKYLKRFNFSKEANCYYFNIRVKDLDIPIYLCSKSLRNVMNAYAWYGYDGICIACKHENGLCLSDIEFVIDNEGLLIHEFIHHVDKDKFINSVGIKALDSEYYNDEREFHAHCEQFVNWLDKYMTKERGFAYNGSRIVDLLSNGITKIDKKYMCQLIYDNFYDTDKYSYEDRPYELSRKLLSLFFANISKDKFDLVLDIGIEHINSLLEKQSKAIKPEKKNESLERLRTKLREIVENDETKA